ncbi:MAG: hypothetical protein K0R12_972 [Gammaproteobacteria bacterium]|nr:hypothetical protein [Gammaproteobacteria bacterium]
MPGQSEENVLSPPVPVDAVDTALASPAESSPADSLNAAAGNALNGDPAAEASPETAKQNTPAPANKKDAPAEDSVKRDSLAAKFEKAMDAIIDKVVPGQGEEKEQSNSNAPTPKPGKGSGKDAEEEQSNATQNSAAGTPPSSPLNMTAVNANGGEQGLDKIIGSIGQDAGPAAEVSPETLAMLAI